MISVHIAGIGLAAPGFQNWSQAASVLRGEAPYAPVELSPYQPTRLPGNERRRATRLVRLAFRAAEDAVQSTSLAIPELAAVFATADGDLEITSRICAALAEPVRVVSPTDFHNSVQNAAAGYWSIGTGAQRPSTTVAGHDSSFAIGLLEAAALVRAEGLDTLLVAFDAPAPEPLFAKRPVRNPAAVALVLTAQPSTSTLARLDIALIDGAVTRMASSELETLRTSNPAARALPALELLAKRESGTVYFARAREQIMSVKVTFE